MPDYLVNKTLDQGCVEITQKYLEITLKPLLRMPEDFPYLQVS